MATVSQFETVKRQVSLQDYADSHLERMGKYYICPSCNSGKGPKGTPAFSVYGNDKSQWKCFSCQKGGDVFDLAAIVEGIDDDDQAAKLEAVARWAGIQLYERPKRRGRAEKRRENPSYRPEVKSDRDQAEPEELRAGRDLEAVKVAAWAQAMGDGCEGMEYMRARGFTPEEVRALGVGWDVERRRVTIPYTPGGGGYYHCDRDVTGRAENKYDKPRSALVGKEPLFHAENLAGELCFVVEGQLDALAVEACGFPAVALGTSSSNSLEGEIKGRAFHGTLAVMLDADETGQRQSPELAKKLRDAKVRCNVMEVDFSSSGTGAKDACESFQRDREALAAFLDGERQRAASEAFYHYWERMKEIGAADTMGNIAKIRTLEGAVEPIQTGIAGLDELLGGGLRPGALHALGAIASMGKTTAALQIADHIASTGWPVLFVTIEQSAREMIVKSLTRIMRTLGEAGVVEESSVYDPKARAAWSDETNRLFDEACGIYQEKIAQWLVFLEGMADRPTSAADVDEAARYIADRCGVPPVVFIDYLQLLAPVDEGLLERKNVDLNVKALRLLANKLNTPVVAIASLNRGSYYAPIDLDSFKESGGIEYGADVVMGIQPSGMDDEFAKVRDKGDGQIKRRMAEIVHATKNSNERHLEFKVLKQRGGRPEGAAVVTYLPVCNTFFNGKKCHLPGQTSPEACYN